MGCAEAPDPPPVRRSVWCRICRQRVLLRRVYAWPELGGVFGECSACGNTMKLEEEAASPGGCAGAGERE